MVHKNTVRRQALNNWPQNPTLYEINAWAWLEQLSRRAGQPITLGNVPQAELERIAAYGFDGIWLMGVWQRSAGGRQVAREHVGLQGEYRQALPDYREADVVGSPYCIPEYRVDAALGGDAGLAQLRQQLADQGMRLMLDFVPNHLACDHAWLAEHPERLLQGGPDSLAREPINYFDVTVDGQWRVFAHGRDPYLDGWSDTVQIDYRKSAARRAMADILLSIAERCDGARCDMAMLVTRDIFLRTWGGAFEPPQAEFWPAVVTDLHARHPGFLLLAEVYWDLEWELQQQGFDYTYDKRLYDRLLEHDAMDVRLHLTAGLDYQHRLARFTENHDERRAAATFGVPRSLAAAVLTYTLPGLRLFHEGQLDGWRVKLPVQLGRRPDEPTHPAVDTFYRRLLSALRHPVFREGNWRALKPAEEWAGNPTHRQIVAHRWSLGDEHRLVFVNLSSEPAQALVPLDIRTLAGQDWRLVDVLHDTTYLRRGDDMTGAGLYLDLPGYGYHLFEVQRA
jgi:hypothetical protein